MKNILTPAESTTSMITSWRRSGEITSRYKDEAITTIQRCERYNGSPEDFALLRALMRLDRSKVYIKDGINNIRLGAARVIDFAQTFDGEYYGGRSIIKKMSKLVHATPEDIDIYCTTITVYVSYLYAIAMKKNVEGAHLLSLMEPNLGTQQKRYWLQGEASALLQQNRKFSERKYDTWICQYLNSPRLQQKLERENRLW